MKNTYEKVLNFWMPDHLDKFVENQGERVIDKCTIFITLIFIFISITLSFGLLHVFTEGFTSKVGTQAFSFLFLVFALVIFKKSPNYSFAVLFPFSISLVHLPLKFYQHGMILSPTPIWFLTIPPILLFFSGRKLGLIGYGLYIIEYVVTCFLIKKGQPVTSIEWVYIFSIMISSFIFMFFVLTLEKTQEKWDNELKSRVLQESHSAHLISLGEMSGAIAHEINNPLTIIKGNAQALRKKLRLFNQDEEHEEELKRIEKLLSNVERVTKIVNSLSSLSQRNAAESESFYGAHFEKSFSQYQSLIMERLKEARIELKYDEKDMSVVIPCRPEVLTQTLLTLTSNSIYAVKGQQNPWIEVKIQTFPYKIRLLFADSGPGLNKKVAARLFEPFFTTRTQGEGTGIGLSIVKNKLIAERALIRYDGSQKFTTFVIEFPVEA